MAVRSPALSAGAILSLLTLSSAVALEAQETDRIWGRVHTVSGDVLEGFIRWDRNEGSWADLLDGSKDSPELKYQDWWELAHPGDQIRDRVIEIAGYRITWDDDEPDFASSHESGIRFGHIESLVPTGDDEALLELRSGRMVELTAGSTDIGTDLREILVTDRNGRNTELEWEDLARVEFMSVPAGATSPTRRLHGTVQVRDGPSFTGYIAWDSDEAFTTDTLEGFGSLGRGRGTSLDLVRTIRPSRAGARITFSDGTASEESDPAELDWANAPIQISDPALGQVQVPWSEIEEIRFHPPVGPTTRDAFDGGRHLRGTVLTSDSTEVTGWIRWDADEGYTWELLDGRDGDLTFDVELGKVVSMERTHGTSVAVTVGVTGATVDPKVRDAVRVTLRDGRVFELDGSNDVGEGNDGVFVLEEGSGFSPDDPEAEWIMIRWKDFRAVRFAGEERP